MSYPIHVRHNLKHSTILYVTCIDKLGFLTINVLFLKLTTLSQK
jgi:hypothetical protein